MAACRGAPLGGGGGGRGGISADSEVYLDTYRSSAGFDSKGGLTNSASHVLGVLWSKRTSRQMLIFLSVNVAFMFVELGVGLYTNSLGLMGDAGHMLFDNGALVIGLVASYIGQLPPDAKFTYGYGRVEVLSGFLNSLLLLVVSFHLLTEAASRFLDPRGRHEPFAAHINGRTGCEPCGSVLLPRPRTRTQPQPRRRFSLWRWPRT